MAQARLVNLGYLEGGDRSPDDADDEIRSAIEEFQCDQGLKITGAADAATRAKLAAAHGC